MNKIIFFLFFGLFLFTSCKIFFIKSTKFDNNRFIIKKIDSIENLYIIYAIKNDSLFKIISKKNIEPNLNCVIIKEGFEYDLIFHSEDEFLFLNKYDLKHIHKQVKFVNFYGVFIDRELGVVDVLGYAENLKGLCYCKM